MSEIAPSLDQVPRGDCRNSADLLPAVYEELRKLARSRLRREEDGQTLQTTALVHEAYLKLAGNVDRQWDDRGHFFAAAAHAMRQILVDRARQKRALKRGGPRKRVPYEQVDPLNESPSDEVLAVDDAIRRLEMRDPRKGQIVNLRYFARMTAGETASVLGMSVASVRREWRYIRAWLESELSRDELRS